MKNSKWILGSDEGRNVRPSPIAFTDYRLFLRSLFEADSRWSTQSR